MNSVSKFFSEVKTETKKVSYPSKDELVGSTWVVIIASIIMSFYLGLIDWGLSSLVKILLQ